MSTKLVKAGVLVSIAVIKTPDNFAALLAMPRIKRLATSIKAVTQIAPVVLQKAGDGYKLWAGHDRLAAATLAGRTTIRADVREGSDADFLLLQMAENSERRPAGELIDEYRATDSASVTSDVKPGKSTTYKKSTAARQDQAIADARGVSADAERKRRERKAAKKKEQTPASPEVEKEEVAPTETPLPEGFQAYGIPIPEADRHAIAETLAWLRDLESGASRVVREMTSAEKHRSFTVAPNSLQAIRQAAQALGYELRRVMPAALCPYCKYRPALVTNCAGCGGVGIVGRHAGDHVPRELLAIEPVMVAVNGQIVPLDQAGSALAPKAKKNGKAIHVEVVDEVGAAPRELILDRSAAQESEELF
jgi:ParB-like chromosome segregation protein Spo0J